MSGINGQVLEWARIRAGLSLEEVATAFKKQTSDVEAWEIGEAIPTYPQLEKLAYQLYKRPVALFFLPELPSETEQSQEFRTLPEFVLEELSSDTRYAIRQARAMQIALEELSGGMNLSERRIFVDLDPGIDTSPIALAGEVRNHVRLSLPTQLSWSDNDEALKNWRNAVQESGIFIFKRSFKQSSISGFSLLHNVFPVIYLNNSNPFSRQIFTIFHELAHILLHTSGVTRVDDSYIEGLSGSSRHIELFCNEFAAEFLVPSDDFSQWEHEAEFDDDFFDVVSRNYHVSREVILRKLRDHGRVSSDFYSVKVSQWAEQLGRNHSGAGGSYYNNQLTYFGDKFLNLAFGRLHQGRCTVEQLSEYMDVKVRNLPALEQAFLGRAPF